MEGNHKIFNFDNEAVLEFSKVFGSTVMDLDSNLESVVDTGDSLIFQFIGGGSITLDGVTGYDDFTSFSMDYVVLINH